MSAATKIGFALVVAAVLMLNPIGACAGMAFKASAPSHSCCPKPGSTDCSNSGCVCLSTPGLPIVLELNDEAGSLQAAYIDDNLNADVEHASWEPAFDLAAAVSPPHRFLLFHQFLI